MQTHKRWYIAAAAALSTANAAEVAAQRLELLENSSMAQHKQQHANAGSVLSRQAAYPLASRCISMLLWSDARNADSEHCVGPAAELKDLKATKSQMAMPVCHAGCRTMHLVTRMFERRGTTATGRWLMVVMASAAAGRGRLGTCGRERSCQ